MMDISTLKTLFLTTVFMLLGCLEIQAQTFILPPTGYPMTIKLDEAGTLPDRITKNELYKISKLKIIGEINGTDLRVIREMAGKDEWGNDTDGILSVLDLSEARIVKGGDYWIYGNDYSTSKDKIGYYLFDGCSGLTSITLPPLVTEIGESAFSGCSGLTSITLPSRVTKIGNSAFSYCRGLTSLTLSSGVAEIGNDAFASCGLKEVSIYVNGDLETYLAKDHPNIGVECSIKYYLNDKEINNVVIPSNVTSLGCYAFQNSSLTSITLPSSLASIGDCAFKNCSSYS